VPGLEHIISSDPEILYFRTLELPVFFPEKRGLFFLQGNLFCHPRLQKRLFAGVSFRRILQRHFLQDTRPDDSKQRTQKPKFSACFSAMKAGIETFCRKISRSFNADYGSGKVKQMEGSRSK